jgi:hypothetical protein
MLDFIMLGFIMLGVIISSDTSFSVFLVIVVTLHVVTPSVIMVGVAASFTGLERERKKNLKL